LEVNGGTGDGIKIKAGNTTNDDSFLVANSSDATLLKVDGGGNVGIGTDRPTTNCKLHVADGDVQVELEGTVGSASGFINFDGTNLQLSTNRNMKTGVFSNASKSNATMIMTGATGGSTVRFYTAAADNTTASERMRIDSSGNLLVNATSASARFQVNHTSASTPTCLFLNQSTASSGVGAIQTSIPSQSNNTNCYHFKGTTQGIASYYLYGNGTSSFTSDERQKKNIVATRDGYLDDLKRLRVVDYHWNTQEDTEDKSVGLIAQEVEQVFPHLVIEHEMEGVGLRKNLRGSEFTFVLIKAIQEQQAMIEELKAEVAALKGA